MLLPDHGFNAAARCQLTWQGLEQPEKPVCCLQQKCTQDLKKQFPTVKDMHGRYVNMVAAANYAAWKSYGMVR
jgi:hypothetical protein